jgi:hypothetical protein
MAKDKTKTKTKKTKVKKISNVLQRVVVNVQPARPRSKNTKAYSNNGFNQFQAQSRMMLELNNMPNRIKEIVGARREESNTLMEERFKQISIEQDTINRKLAGRIEKQTLNKYLENIAGFMGKNIKDLKSGAQEFETGVPI